jgi:sugar phosphate permease
MEASASEHSRMVQRSPINYGWIILIVGTLGMIMSSPGQTYGVSIFIERFREDLGLSRSLISSLYTMGTITASLTLPFVGRQIDKRGARAMVVMITILFGLASIYMGFVQNAVMLGIGFVGIRMLGQGGMSIVSRYVINQWWVRRRGTILGIASLFASVLGVGLFPNLANWLIPRYGWRTAYPILGILVMSIMIPVGYGFFRDRPERYGLLPDAGLEQRGKKKSAAATAPIEENWTLAEVVRTRVFWFVAMAASSFDMLVTGITFHIVSIYADRGLSPDSAAITFVPIAVTSAVVSLISGILIDRVKAKYLLSIGLFLMASTLLFATRLASPTAAFVFGIIMGMTNGLSRTISNVVWANYFGRQNLGTISGLTSTIGSAASGLGPLWFGIGRDLAGSYYPALLISALFPFVMGILALFIRRPRREAQPTQ